MSFDDPLTATPQSEVRALAKAGGFGVADDADDVHMIWDALRREPLLRGEPWGDVL